MSNSSRELYWAAGFWDGEGCASSDGGKHLSLYVNQVSPGPLFRFQRAVGQLGSVNGPITTGGGNSSPYWRWSAHGASARHIVALLLPLVCGPKQEQFTRVLATVSRVSDGQLKLVA